MGCRNYRRSDEKEDSHMSAILGETHSKDPGTKVVEKDVKDEKMAVGYGNHPDVVWTFSALTNLYEISLMEHRQDLLVFIEHMVCCFLEKGPVNFSPVASGICFVAACLTRWYNVEGVISTTVDESSTFQNRSVLHIADDWRPSLEASEEIRRDIE